MGDTSGLRIRSSHCANFVGVEVLRPGELYRSQVKIRLAPPTSGASLLGVCLHREPAGEGNQFVLRLRADILVLQAAFSGCLEKAGEAAVRFWGARSLPPVHGEPLCRPLLLTVLVLRMWPPKKGPHVAYRPRFRCRSKLQLLGVGSGNGGGAKKPVSFGSSEAL